VSAPDGKRRPVEAAPPVTTDDDCTTVSELPMAYQWLACPRHGWLGVSILAGRSFSPSCFLEDGSSHPVELDGAA
jgi:hypothetical protein